MREWIIRGGSYENHPFLYADGEVPGINEIIPVVEKKEYEKLQEIIQDLGWQLEAANAKLWNREMVYDLEKK